ncbi:MAG: hypothetical protein V4456_00580 [Bacteroidota bacterium]
MRGLSYIFYFSIIILSSCTVHKQSVKTPEKLGVNKLKKLVAEHLSSVIPMPAVIKKDTLTQVYNYNEFQRDFAILQKDLKNGNIITTSFSPSEGYTKSEYNSSTPHLKKTTYFLKGQIRSAEEFYSEKYLEPNPKPIEYPVKTAYYYDEQGNIIQKINNESGYNVSFQEVKEIIKLTVPDGQITQAEFGRYIDGNIIWKIYYVSEKYDLSFLKINAITGEVLNHSHKIHSHKITMYE